MCTSVPQMVVAVMRITASPPFGLGFGTSSIRRSLTPRNTTTFIVSMIHLTMRGTRKVVPRAPLSRTPCRRAAARGQRRQPQSCSVSGTTPSPRQKGHRGDRPLQRHPRQNSGEEQAVASHAQRCERLGFASAVERVRELREDERRENQRAGARQIGAERSLGADEQGECPEGHEEAVATDCDEATAVQ